MSDVLKFNGLKELQDALDTLAPKIEKNILRGALRQAAKRLAEGARERAPKRTGLLAESIRVGTLYRDGKVTSYVRAGKNRANDYKHGFYAHWVEFGTKPHVIEAGPGKLLPVHGGVKSVEHPGSEGRYFMRNAFDHGTPEAIEAAADYMRERLASKYGIDIPGPEDILDGEE